MKKNGVKRNFRILALTLCLVTTLNTFSQWSQMGVDIEGDSISMWFGVSVGANSDGTIVAVGAFGNIGPNNAGQAVVYKHNGTGWAQLGQRIVGESAHDRACNVSLSADGLTIVIGAINNDPVPGISKGHARVYRYDGTNWLQMGNDIDGENQFDGFGSSVDISSDGLTVVIGANGNDGSGIDAGHVRVFSFNGTDWVQKGSDIQGEGPGDESGWSAGISSDGSVIAIGSPFNQGAGLAAGHTRVFKFDGLDWIQLGSDINGEAPGDAGGYSVSLSSNGLRLAIGAPYNDGTTGVSHHNCGHVRVYEYSGSNWVQLGNDIDSQQDQGDQFGNSVSLNGDGNTLLVGAVRDSDVAIWAGGARIYKYDGGEWNQYGISLDGELFNDQFGWSSKLSEDGSTAIIGGPTHDIDTFWNAGYARVYRDVTVGTYDFGTDRVFDVYPNPSAGHFTFTGLQTESTIKVYDLSGKLMMEHQANEEEYSIDLSNYDNGIYLYEILGGDESQYGKLIKK